MKNIFLNIRAIILLALVLGSCSEKHTLFVGGFSKPGEKGLSVFSFDSRNGKAELITVADVGPSPTWFCYSPGRKLLYALNEVMEFKGSFGGGLTTLKFDPAGKSFKKLNEMVVPYAGPCHMSVSADSGYLFIANYPNGSVAVVRLDGSGIPEAITDTILFKKSAPDESKGHMIQTDPAGERVYVADLGLNRLMIFNFDSNSGRLDTVSNGIIPVAAGSGPRHFVFSRDGSRLYLINELGSTIMVFDVDRNVGLRLRQTVATCRPGFAGNNYCAEVAISHDGKYLYGSNRGENTIVTFRIGADGGLTLGGHTACGGDWPRSFAIDPSGNYLLVGNQKSDTISVLRIDRSTGLPSRTVNRFRSVMPAYLRFVD